MSRYKLKEPGRKNIIPKRDDDMFYKKIGPSDINDWFVWVDRIVSKAKQDNNSVEDFIRVCRSNGLVITYPHVFLRVYYSKNISKEYVDSLIEKGVI